MPVLHPKFLQCFGICTHPCNLGTHTGGLTRFHPPLDTTTLAIGVDGVQRVCQILRHGEEIFQNLILCLFVLPRNLFRCVLPTPGVTMMHHATKCGVKDCPGFLNSTGRLGPKRGRKCYVTPAFWGSPTKETKSEVKTYARGHHDAPSISKCGSLV